MSENLHKLRQFFFAAGVPQRDTHGVCTFSMLDESRGWSAQQCLDLATFVSLLVQKPTIKQGSQERVGSIDTWTGSLWVLPNGKNCKSPFLLVVKPLDLVFHMHPSIPSWLGLLSPQVLCPYCLSPRSSHRITNLLLKHQQLPSGADQHICFHTVLPLDAHPEQMFPSPIGLAKVLSYFLGFFNLNQLPIIDIMNSSK